MIKFNLQIKHSEKLTITKNKIEQYNNILYNKIKSTEWTNSGKIQKGQNQYLL